MNRRILALVAAALLLPVVIRFVWFFPGLVLPRSIPTPDYINMKMPQAPISTAVAAPAVSGSGTVLFDYKHDNRFTFSEIQPLTDALTQRGAHIVLNSGADELASQLKSAGSYVVISPSDSFKPGEISLIESFVARGGHVVVFTDATRGSVQYDFAGNAVASLPDVETVLPLLEPFGISVNADYLYDLDNNEGNFRNVYLKPLEGSDLTAGLGMVIFYGTHSLTTDGGSPLLVGGQGTLSSSTDARPEDASQQGWAAAVASKDASVLAFGDFSFLTSPYNLVADNQLLIARVADFLLSPRAPTLADYPYVFRGPGVSLLVTSDLQMTAEMTDAIAGLQSTLADSGLQLNTVQQAPAQGDLIVLGTYALGSDLSTYVRSFDLQADDFGEFVTVAPFGKLGQSGNGLLLFHAGQGGNTLVLLAERGDDVKSLLEAVSGEALDGCLVQGDVAACSIGFGGSFLEGTPTPVLIPGIGTATPFEAPGVGTPTSVGSG